MELEFCCQNLPRLFYYKLRRHVWHTWTGRGNGGPMDFAVYRCGFQLELANTETTRTSTIADRRMT